MIDVLAAASESPAFENVLVMSAAAFAVRPRPGGDPRRVRRRGDRLARRSQRRRTHPLFHTKLEAIGYGFLVPLFFVTSGANLDVEALFDGPETVVKVVIFTVSMLGVRGLPVLLGRGKLDPIRLTVAGLLESGSLPILVTAATIGTATGQMASSTAAALVIAGLVATIIYPTLALALLKRVDPDPNPDPTILDELNPEEM